MDILTTIIYIILFIIVMIVVFSIGMLRPFMPKKEVAIVLLSAFIIGCLGGAFFLIPIYDDIPEVVGSVEKLVPNNEETMYLEFSSAVDVSSLKENLTHTQGVKSFEVTSITFYMWQFNDRELAYMNSVIKNIDSNYKNFTVNKSGKIDIELVQGADPDSSLKSFSDWYKQVYQGSLSYAQIHAKVVLDSSAIDQVKQILLDKGIVPTKIDGPVQNSIDKTNQTMLSNNEFIIFTGIIGVIVAICGIYFDAIVVAFRILKKFGKLRK